MKIILTILSLIFATFLTACSNESEPSTVQQDTSNILDNTVTIVPELETNESDVTDPQEEDVSEDVIENQPTNEIDDDSIDESAMEEVTKEFDFQPVDVIPLDDQTIRKEHSGTIEHISYQTKDYFDDNSEITKHAYVYLPYNYDASGEYNVLYLMHGIGGSEKEWGMFNDSSKVKAMMDNLIYNEIIDPFIIVAPNGRSSKNFANTSSDHNSFYVFGQELRNDLIPYIDKNFATFGEYDDKGYDLTAARDHRAMAGLSMGGMQTINIGMCESLDIISYFGAFSAAPTTYTASNIATALKDYPDDDIHYFYNICGLQDGIAIGSASSAVKSLTTLTDKLTEDVNFTWQEVKGGHDFNIWYLGFYNFAQIAFQVNK